MPRGVVRLGSAVAVLLLAPSGCSDPAEDYCATLADERSSLRELTNAKPDAGSVAEAAALFGRLADAAPDDLDDEWLTFVNAWQGLADALAVAGDEEGVETERAIRGAGDKLRSPSVVDAAAGIEQHARDVCGVDLGGAGL